MGQAAAMPVGNGMPKAPSGLRSGMALAMAGLAFLLFAGQFIISRHGVLEGLTPYDITALRVGVAGLIAAPLLIRWGVSDLGGIGWTRGILLASVAGAPYFVLMIGGLAFAPAANVVVINPGMTLIGGLLLSMLWLGEPRSALRLLAGAVALTGLMLVGGDSVTDPSGDTWIGNLMFAASGLVWALYMALLNRWRINPVRAAVVVAVLSMIYLPVYSVAVTPQLSQAPLIEIALQAIYQGIIHALVAIGLFSYAVRTLGVGPVALMTPIVPVAGLAMAAVFLGEGLSRLQWVGAALVCAGMLLAAWQVLRKPAAP